MSTGAPSETQGHAPRLHPSRRALVKGAAWAAPVAAMSVAAPAYALSCPNVVQNAQARGIFLSGNLLGLDLDALAEQPLAAIRHAHAQAVAGTPWELDNGGLIVQALDDFLTLDLTGTGLVVSDVLTGLTNQNLGALNQFAYADENTGGPNSDSGGFDGTNSGEVGASGTINDSTGAVNFSEGNSAPPSIGTIDLKSILAQLGAGSDTAVGQLLANTANVTLDVGALFGHAFMDEECLGTTSQLTVERDYLIAYLKLVVESQLIGDVFADLVDAPLEISVDLDLIQQLLGTVLLGLANVEGHLTLTLDATKLDDAPIPNDPNAAFRLDPAGTTLTLDLASLLDGGINGQSPNTQLFVDAPAIDGDATDLVDSIVDAIVARITELVTVEADLTLSTGGIIQVDVARITIAEGTSLASLLDGSTTAEVDLLGELLELDAVLVTDLLGQAIMTTLNALFDAGGALESVVTTLNNLLGWLFEVLTNVLAIYVNAQNAQETGDDPPAAYQNITEGRYDVAALHLELVGALNLLNLSLARGSVGENTPRV